MKVINPYRVEFNVIGLDFELFTEEFTRFYLLFGSATLKLTTEGNVKKIIITP